MRRIAAVLTVLVCLVCLAGSVFASELPQVRGYDNQAESDYQYLLFGTYPYEEDGTEKPVLWRILGRDGDRITLFTEYIIDAHQITEIDNYQKSINHKYKKNIAFEESDLFAWVNGTMTERLLKAEAARDALVEDHGGLFHIMSDEELMNTVWGFPDSVNGTSKENPNEVIAPLAKNRMGFGTPWAKAYVPYEKWGSRKNKLYQDYRYNGTVAYWGTRLRPQLARIVGANGHLSWSGFGNVQIGIRPAMVLDLTKLQLTGGTGTLEDPWQVGPAGGTEMAEQELPAEDEPAEEAAASEEGGL